MRTHITNAAAALVLGLLLGSPANAQGFVEIYSNASGSVQFLMTNHSTQKETLVASNGSTERSVPIPGPSMLVGTQGFADLNVVKPDVIVPNGFFFLDDGSFRFDRTEHGSVTRGYSFRYVTLPTDGQTALWWDDESGGWFEGSAVATNGAGESYTFATPSPGSIGPGFTGAWYDPAQSGHGLFIEVLSDNRLFAGWFTFNPAGNQQAWFVGAGTYSGNVATIADVRLPTGGRWIPNFDPGQVVNNPWGTLTFTFADCNHGKVDFNSTLGYGTGSMNLTRLTQPAGLSCP